MDSTTATTRRNSLYRGRGRGRGGYWRGRQQRRSEGQRHTKAADNTVQPPAGPDTLPIVGATDQPPGLSSVEEHHDVTQRGAPHTRETVSKSRDQLELSAEEAGTAQASNKSPPHRRSPRHYKMARVEGWVPPHLRVIKAKKEADSQLSKARLQDDSQIPQVHDSEYVPPHLRRKTQKAGGVPVPVKKATPERAQPAVKPPVKRQKWVSEPLNTKTPSPERLPERSIVHPLSPPRKPTTNSSMEQRVSNNTSAVKPQTTADTSPGINMQAVYDGYKKCTLDSNNRPVAYKKAISPVKKTTREARGWPKNPRPRPVTPDSNAWGSWESPEVVEVVVDGGDDPDYDIRQLTDWNGDWLPAPVEWENRKGFRHRGGNFSKWLHDWSIDNCNNHKIVAIGDPNTTSASLIHPDWVPKIIGEESPQAYWDSFCRSAPEPIDEVDLTWKPWWLTVTDSTFVPAPNVPADKMEHHEEVEYKKHASFGPTSEAAVNWYCKEEDLKAITKKRQKAEIKAKQKAAKAEFWASYVPPPDISIKPELNIYLRPMVGADIPQVTAIYNWHQQHSVGPPETDLVSIQTMTSRITDIENAHFPVLVAVEKVASKKARSGEFALQERIAGYCIVDDYHSRRSHYRYTGEIEVYVRDDCRRKLVGTCLMDKMMSLVDVHYEVRGGYEWRCHRDYTGQYMRGGRRTMAKMMIRLGYYDGDLEFFDRAEKWLQQFKFKQCGNESLVGAKDGRFTNVAPFEFTTSYVTMGLFKPVT